MATNREILQAIEELANGEGIGAIKLDISQIKSDLVELKGDVRNLKGDVRELKEDVKELRDKSAEIEQHGFASEDSLRNRIKSLEVSVNNIKKYELAEIKERFKSNQKNKNTIFIQSILIVLAIVAGYIGNSVFGS